MADRIEPGAMVAVLGGGQLGAMFAAAAKRLGYRVAVWDPDPDAPALRLADRAVCAAFTDPEPVRLLTAAARAVTYEWENVSVAAPEALERVLPVRPSARVLQLLQNRLTQKTFLAGRGIPVAPFRPLREPPDLRAVEELGFPCLCKTATSGYDGKGQWRLNGADDVAALADRLFVQPRSPGHSEWVLERFLPFQQELSVLVARGVDGGHRVYPAVSNLHEGGILRLTRVPAAVEAGTAGRAEALALSVIETLDAVGVLCVELFLMADGRLFVNEVAPRPHNSGHYTLDACTVSQFEQQVRAVCGLPLGEVRLLSSAVMLNLLGEDLTRATTGEGLAALLGRPGAALHVYGKAAIRPGRKMGHVTFLAEKADEAWEAATAFRRVLGHRPA
jgi:5-(carboxyamino)imidazole ribonucleotide synthase